MSRFCIVQGSVLAGTLAIPPSKSQTLRAILFGALAKGKSTIRRYLVSPDTQAMCTACRHLGAKVEMTARGVEIEGVCGKIDWTEDVIHAGNSGIVLRFCTAVGALSSHPVVVTGDYSIRHLRPMQPLIEGLSQLGVSALSMRGDGHAPVVIQGPIQPGRTSLSGEDSQPVSALLIAGAFASGPIEIEVRNPGEKPWVGLTLSWFDRLHIPYEQSDFDRFCLSGQATYPGFTYDVPGDLSSAAFPIAAALITQSELCIDKIDLTDPQGDKVFITYLQQMGAKIEVDQANQRLRVKRSPPLSGISIDINQCIDCLPILAALACFATSKTTIYNGAIAKQKECDRIHGIATELRKMGATIEELSDGLAIDPSPLKGADLNTYQDHRIAMALSIAALGASGKTTIGPIDCILKTFATFAHDFKALGAHIEVFDG